MSLLKAKHAVVALSNGNIALVLAMAKRAGIPWDTIPAADLVGTYKPDAAIYRQRLAPSRHRAKPGDDGGLPIPAHLDAAKSRGLMTAYVHRPLEWGPGTERALPATGTYDLVCNSFTELAEVLGV